ncbi:MAG TPA: hypothetical protein VEX68_10075 [Bryobacteraceae bacterium]|nr:hypothetical protein [Bryobacteraceae bacterium]
MRIHSNPGSKRGHRPSHSRALLWSLTLSSLLVIPGWSQDASPQQQTQQEATSVVSGTVVSVSPTTTVIKTEGGNYLLVVFTREATKPRTLAVGSVIRVTTVPGETPGTRVARSVVIEKPPAPDAAKTSTEDAAAVPAEVRKIESDIKRQFRRFRAGLRTGVTLDPELIMIGAHMQMGPIFSSDLFFRPNIEFAWGEVSTMFSINPEVIYRLPVTARAGRWNSYVGFGPGFNFVNQSFESGEDRFSDFHSAIGLNLFGGLHNRSGMFVELKASVYSEPAPTLRLIVGYNF